MGERQGRIGLHRFVPDACGNQRRHFVPNELRPALEAQLEAELAQYREAHREEVARYREALRQSFEQQIAEQLYDDEAGRRAVEQARDIIVRRLKSDREVYKELLARRPATGGSAVPTE